MVAQKRTKEQQLNESMGGRDGQTLMDAKVVRIKAANSPSPATFESLHAASRMILKQWKDLKGSSAPHAAGQDEHSHRVALFAWRIAKLLGLPNKQAGQIMRGAFLHDVGWVCVPGASVLKPGSLSADERIGVLAHPGVGYELLRAFPSTEDIAGMALFHHERYDGDGYPEGLQGAHIPIEARVLAIADCLDAMMSSRPYRRALSYSQALGEIVQSAGKQFDPGIVEVIAQRAKSFASFLGNAPPTASAGHASSSSSAATCSPVPKVNILPASGSHFFQI
jgi:HD-GYP domain-containing protein (c-di-GMP phosphodiesterase class II)